MNVRLRRVDPSGPGITRRGRGRGFEYFWPSGDKVTDADELDRLRGLAVPPAWRDVWICPHPDGHLQAVGVDAAGRRQYLYHPAWRERRDAAKFDHMLEFARRLPDLRASCVAALEDDAGLGRERVLACAVRLLDHGFFRIGTERPVDESDAVGLTTMRREHVSVRSGDVIEFDYPAKGGKRRVRQLTDPAVAVAVNAPADSAARRRAITRACREVAHHLGNTPTVARDSYSDPRVFDRFASGWVVDVLAVADTDAGFGVPSYQGPIEQAVRDLLSDRTDADGVVDHDRVVDDLRGVA